MSAVPGEPVDPITQKQKEELVGLVAEVGNARPNTEEERLESLRFFTAEGNPEMPKSLLDWMQEAENQIAALRARRAGTPSEDTE